MEIFGYRYDIPSFPITPPYTYPYDYKFCTLPKSEEKIHIVQDIYPQFPTPPLSGSPSPPAIWQKDYLHSPAERTSVIMKVTDHKVIEVKPTSPKQDEEYRCQWIDCWRMFNTLDALASHVTQVHAVASIGGLYYCKWEGCPRIHRGFNARYKMLVHVRTHTKEKPHQCQLCDKSFSRAENLKIHIRSHSGEKPYVCPFEGCNKAYSNSSDRFKHTRTHSTEKPYVCKIPGCQKRYTDPSSLRKHVKTYKHTSNLEESPQLGEQVSTEMINSTEYPHLAMCSEEKTVTTCDDGLFPNINCHCNHDCFDTYRKPNIYKFGKYFNEMFVTYEQSSDSISPSYWIEPHAQPKPTSIHHSILPMDIDMPLDLTVNRGSR